MARFCWIVLGGAVGTAARYLLSGWCLRHFGPGFPWGTLAVNLVGCFFIAAIMHVGLTTTILSETTRYALTTGFLGGFTTYSAFSYETFVLLNERAWLLACTNVFVMLFGGLAACLLGLTAARAFAGR